jgi:hypothetical protein
MNNDNVFRSENFELTHQGRGVLKMKLKGFIKSAQMQDSTSKINEFVSRHHIKYLLIDQRELKVLTKDVMEFISKSVGDIQRMKIEKVGTLDPVDVFAKAGIFKIHQETRNTKFVTMHFQTEEECLAWFYKEN